MTTLEKLQDQLASLQQQLDEAKSKNTDLTRSVADKQANLGNIQNQTEALVTSRKSVQGIL